MAGELAREHNIPVVVFPAEWDRYGRAAGSIRNRQMLITGRPTKVYAFHNHIHESRGTLNMIGQAKAHGIEDMLWTEEGVTEIWGSWKKGVGPLSGPGAYGF